MKSMKFWTQHDLMIADCGQRIGFDRLTANERKQAEEQIADVKPFDHFTITKNAHFTMLNAAPPVVGTRWMINEAVYDYCLGQLPPLRLPASCVSQPITGGFAMSEAVTGDTRSAYYRDTQGRFWHEYVDLEWR